jgi:methionyl-tRNA synthetase
MMNYLGNGGGGNQFFGLGLASMAGLGLIFLVIGVAVISLKGYSLWTAAKRDEKWWFIILLVINTMGILELIYLYFVANKWGKSEAGVAGSDSSGSTNTANPSPKITDTEPKNTATDRPSGSTGSTGSGFVKQ